MNLYDAAVLLDEAYNRWNELEVEFYRQRIAYVLVDKEVTKRRKKAAKVLMQQANTYSSLSGEVFDWPREAVEHARTYLRSAA